MIQNVEDEISDIQEKLKIIETSVKPKNYGSRLDSIKARMKNKVLEKLRQECIAERNSIQPKEEQTTTFEW